MDIILTRVWDLSIDMTMLVGSSQGSESDLTGVLVFADEKYSQNVSRATSKDEMNVDLTPKKQKDLCKSPPRDIPAHTFRRTDPWWESVCFSLHLVDTLSLTSEASSMPVDNEFDDLLNSRDIESLSQELANRGPQLCEQQIR